VFESPLAAQGTSPHLRQTWQLHPAHRLARQCLARSARYRRVLQGGVAAITTTVKQEFATKEKAKAAKTATPKPAVKAPTKVTKKAVAA